MRIKIEAVTNSSDSQNRLIGGLLAELVSVHDHGVNNVKFVKGPICATSGFAWSRLLSIELKVEHLSEEAIVRRLDAACREYCRAEGPHFRMTWTSPTKRTFRPAAKVNTRLAAE